MREEEVVLGITFFLMDPIEPLNAAYPICFCVFYPTWVTWDSEILSLWYSLLSESNGQHLLHVPIAHFSYALFYYKLMEHWSLNFCLVLFDVSIP